MAPNDRGWEEIRIGIALSSIAVVAVVMRFVARYVRRLQLEIDDWLSLASLVAIVAMLVELILGAVIGNSGKHSNSLSTDGIATFWQIFLSNEFTYGVTSPLVKLTLLAFYRRLFRQSNFHIVADICSVLCVLWGFITILVSGLQCRPLAKYWSPTISGTCINQLAFMEGIQGINVILDLAILVMPLPMVWRLHRPWQDRVALSSVFLIGGFVVSASIIRLASLTQISGEDFTYTSYNAVIWTFVEPCIGLTCSSLPIIRGLFPLRTSKEERFYKRPEASSSWRRTPVGHIGSHFAHASYIERGGSGVILSKKGHEELFGANGRGINPRNSILVRTTVEVF